MKKHEKDTIVAPGTDIIPFVEALLERPLSPGLRREYAAHPLTLHETVSHGAAAANALSAPAAQVVRAVRELLAPHAAVWDAEVGPPARPTWLDAAIREAKASGVTDSDVVAASRRLGL